MTSQPNSHAISTQINKCISEISMHTSGGLRSEEANGAAWEGGKGALYGAVKWGAFAALLGGVGYGISPIYRGLTIQFKVFLQMSGNFVSSYLKSIELMCPGMILGGCLEADHRIREYEAKLRIQKRILRDRAAWDSYEKEYEETPNSKSS
ncbi:hypothetical protein BDZ45DRAFT_380226 [Acephala macrosclerotiorum]|nr:hypothetical protein BDZ45DRAFT_380226 [Acephala macrosclerotiorum]